MRARVRQKPSRAAVKIDTKEGCDERIQNLFVDAEQPATLNDGHGTQTDCPTLREAVLLWHTLPSGQKVRATVKVIGGPVYTALQIDQLHYGPKPV